MSRNKTIERALKRLQKELRAHGGPAAHGGVLQEPVAADLLVPVREQKLLLRTDDDHAFEALRRALETLAVDLMPAAECERYRNYLALAARTRPLERALTTRSEQILDGFPRLPVADLVRVSEQVLVAFAARLPGDAGTARAYGPTPLPDLSAGEERAVHDWYGRLNDVAFAVARALNEASRQSGQRAGSPGRAIRDEATRRFVQLVSVAAEWNSLRYVVDQVSYGHWYVESVEQDVVRFGVADPGLDLARMVALRRNLVDRLAHKPREPRWIREIMKDWTESTLESALDHYEARTRPVMARRSDVARLLEEANELLGPLGAEDDLLLACAGDQTASSISEYAAAFAVRVFRDAARFVGDRLPKRAGEELAVPVIPAKTVGALFGGADGAAERVGNAVMAQATRLPARQHTDLIRWPFVAGPNDTVQALRLFDCADWPTAVRERVIDGGRLGERLGEEWETFVRKGLLAGGWEVVDGRRRLSDGEHTLTDIDLLALQQGVLLVGEVKAVTGSALTAYDHWKARGVIAAGARQARLAASVLDKERDRLVSMHSRRYRDAVTDIIPVVVTNSPLFDGWVCGGVNVLGYPTISTLTDGARVEYVGSQGVVVAHQIAAPDALTREDILSLIRRPFRIRVAGESSQVRYDRHEFAGGVWEIPEFEPVPVDLEGPRG